MARGKEERSQVSLFDVSSPKRILFLILRVACAVIHDTLRIMVHQGFDPL